MYDVWVCLQIIIIHVSITWSEPFVSFLWVDTVHVYKGVKVFTTEIEGVSKFLANRRVTFKAGEKVDMANAISPYHCPLVATT